MLKPEYRVTPFLIRLFEKIAAQIAIIENSRVKLPARLNLERDAVNRSVHSSTLIGESFVFGTSGGSFR